MLLKSDLNICLFYIKQLGFSRFIRPLVLTFLLALCSVTPAISADASFIRQEGGGQSISLTAVEINQGQQATLTVNFPEEVTFIIKRGSPNVQDIIAIRGTSGDNLTYDLPTDTLGFNEYGDLEEGYSLELTVADINGDSKPEVLIAIGDHSAIMTVAIFTYNSQDVKPFRRTGLITGQNSLHIKLPNRLIAPYGSQGLFTEYTVAADGTVKNSTLKPKECN